MKEKTVITKRTQYYILDRFVQQNARFHLETYVTYVYIIQDNMNYVRKSLL